MQQTRSALTSIAAALAADPWCSADPHGRTRRARVQPCLSAVLASVLLAALPPDARAQQPTFSFDLDTKEAHWSHWKMHGLAEWVGCTFRARIAAAYEDENWAPLVGVSIQDAAGQSEIALRFARQKGDESFVAHILVRKKAGSRISNLTTRAAVDEPLSVSVNWAGSGVLFSVNHRVLSLTQLDFEPAVLMVLASTADFVVDDLSLLPRED